MKKMFYIPIFLACALSLMHATEIKAPQEEVNRLNWVEIYNGRISTQIMFDFSNPIDFRKKIDKDTFQLRLIFPGMQVQHFSMKQVITKLSELKRQGLIKNVQIFEKNKTIPKVVLAIDFEKTMKANKHQACPNKILIKWYKMESPNRLVIDIFTQENLDKLKNKNETILFARNDTIKSDINPKFKKPNSNTKINRIILDPGHGGEDMGAECFNLIEKTIALDIAKKARAILKKNGFNVLMTRQKDCEISLVQRSELAEQLKADLFISIHVNSTKNRPTACNGIETFYLENCDLITPTRHGGFLFINLKKDRALIELTDQYVQNNTQTSKALALAIQNSLINHLKNNQINISDRGIKADKFRVLLRSPIPSALVEVGFITNEDEASNLAGQDYRKKIAQGICNGISNFIEQ
jgi:N-acetylmuramoyl-L-alanine amidase